MLPVGVQRFVAGSYSSAVGVYGPPATSTRPSGRRTAPCSPRGCFSVPPGSQVPVGGSYSSAVEARLVSPSPPTTRTRPFPSRVAVGLERAVDMLAVAVQLPAAVLATDRFAATGRAPSRSELEPEPKPSAGTASASSTQVAGATGLKLTTNVPSRLDERGEDKWGTLRRP